MSRKKKLRTYALTLLSTYALLLACRDRAHISPEDIVLDTATIDFPMVQTLISGTVYCQTCQGAASMLIEVSIPNHPSLEPMVQVPFDQVGAYQVTVKVQAKTVLKIVAHVFAPGGVITDEQMVEVPEGESAVALTVNLKVP